MGLVVGIVYILFDSYGDVLILLHLLWGVSERCAGCLVPVILIPYCAMIWQQDIIQILTVMSISSWRYDVWFPGCSMNPGV